MLEIIIQGRGGQGAQTAGNLLAKAFFLEQKHIQVFATYGGARRGTPVSSYLRVDDKPIRRRCNIEFPDAILCFDDSLLENQLLKGTDSNTRILVNTCKPAKQFVALSESRFYTIDGLNVSRKNDLDSFINTALLGAFSAVLNMPSIDSVKQTIVETTSLKVAENINACEEGYQYMLETARAKPV